jgi:hypothetical protein
MTAGCDPLESAAPERGGSGFRHGAICYRTPAELLDTLGPLVSGAIERDERVSVVLDPPTWEGLRDRLGTAADAVVRADHHTVHSWSGQTSADRLAEQLRELTADGGRGVFLARRLCDLLHLWTGPDGTRVRVESGR